MFFCHVEIKDGNRNQPFSGEVEARYSHHHGRDLPIADGFGWIGADSKVAIVLGRVVKSDGSVIPCKLTEARLMGMIDHATDVGKKITLEVHHV